MALFGFATCLSAQTTQVVIPAGFDSREGSSSEHEALDGLGRRIQLLIQGNLLSAFKGKGIKRVVFRRDAQRDGIYPVSRPAWRGGRVHMTVEASWTKVLPSDPWPGFSGNRGLSRAIHHQGPMQVPTMGTLNGRKIARFVTSESMSIVLNPAISVPNKSQLDNLCLELIVGKDGNNTPPFLWFIDMEKVQLGAVTVFGHSCWKRPGQDKYSNILQPSAAIGATLRSTVRGPNTGLGVCYFSFNRQRWGPWGLPMDLTRLGAPGCLLSVSLDIPTSTLLDSVSTVDPYGYGFSELKLPLMGALVGFAMHSQWLFFQPTKNSLGLTLSNGSTAKIANTPKDFGVGMVYSRDANSSSGQVFVNRSLVMQLRDN